MPVREIENEQNTGISDVDEISFGGKQNNFSKKTNFAVCNPYSEEFINYPSL